MATLKQITANRLNALKSTGPKSSAGKAAVRLNAHKHLRASNALGRRFHRICIQLRDTGEPPTDREKQLVEKMANAYWSVRQLQIAKSILFPKIHDAAAHTAILEIFHQSEHHFETQFNEAQSELQRNLDTQGPAPQAA